MTANNEIHGILSTLTVELPYETQEEADKAADTNRRLGGLARVFRGATDFGYTAYADMVSNMKRANPMQKHLPYIKPTIFQCGDLVRVFKTVTDGDVHWRGTVALEKTGQYGYSFGQKDMFYPDWTMMFHDAMPAKLVRNGQTIFGALEPFYEQGMGGIAWSVQEYGRPGYAGLWHLHDGDDLTVYSAVRDGAVEWEGTVHFGLSEPFEAGWTTLMRPAKHMDSKKWLALCWQRRPVIVTPK